MATDADRIFIQVRNSVERAMIDSIELQVAITQTERGDKTQIGTSGRMPVITGYLQSSIGGDYILDSDAEITGIIFSNTFYDEIVEERHKLQYGIGFMPSESEFMTIFQSELEEMLKGY